MLYLIGLEAQKERRRSQKMTFPPGPPANRKPGTSVGSPNRHFLINGLWPWVTCQVQGQLNMFTTCNGKNKSFAWILGTRQMANHIHGTEIKVTGSILPRAGNGVACSVNRSWLFFAMSAKQLWRWFLFWFQHVWSLWRWVLPCSAESVWSEEIFGVSATHVNMLDRC